MDFRQRRCKNKGDGSSGSAAEGSAEEQLFRLQKKHFCIGEEQFGKQQFEWSD
jgi:hypothetical protein